MRDLFTILMVLAMLAVVGSLFVGLFFMARGGRNDPRRSNKAMRLRVILQGAALVLFVIAILIKG
ncbi:twin transmembrane helix small protein [Azospirillum ramasamyi]|uniref:Twin transmembrane helix small protein n=1 Tax=Azospirillum ramasamyi TaxID=682998 RepID=A0A2U9SDS7_9PROT|nr:twin transmembrane helix small protein [Azospirillum ramasamyi]AWU97554.1 twin transmembrane helix small protein [Azospirillum ramasamyi]